MVKLDFIDGKKVEYEKGSKEGKYFDGLLVKNLDIVKGYIKQDWDYFWVVDGEEGSGKSVFAQQIAYYLTDGKFSVDNICFTFEEFKKLVVNAKKYDCIIFDESFRGAASRSSMSSGNKAMLTIVQEMRQKNLFVLLILPSFWELDAYLVRHRSKGVFHVYTGEKKARGFFRFYAKEFITDLYRDSRKFKYRYPKYPAFFGSFLGYYCVDEEQYKRNKLIALRESEDEESGVKIPHKPETLYKVSVASLVYLHDGLKYTFKQISDILSIPKRTLVDVYSGFKQNDVISLGNSGFRGGEK